MERGMALEETLYHPLLPEEQQGAGAWNRKLPPVREGPQNSENVSNPRPRKLRRVASSKLGSQNEGIWGDIVGTGFDSFDPRPSKPEEHKKDTLGPPKPVLQEAKSFASESSFSEAQESNRQPSEPAPQARGFLSGCYFLIHDFSQKQVGTRSRVQYMKLTLARKVFCRIICHSTELRCSTPWMSSQALPFPRQAMASISLSRTGHPNLMYQTRKIWHSNVRL